MTSLPNFPNIYAARQFAGLRIGLLGGSFNPAHEGHRHASLMALKALNLHQVWWLVSPQNPLKTTAGTAPLADRIRFAQCVAAHPRIHISDIETRLGTRYTADTLEAFCRRFTQTRFVWIMGADNLIQLPRWRRWHAVMESVPVAVYDRPPYSMRASFSKAAQRYKANRIAPCRAAMLAGSHPPAWAFFHTPLMAVSSTALRNQDRNREPKP